MQSPIKVSVVISSRDEGDNNAFTIHSIINDLETFLNPDEFEIILVDNCSKDDNSWRFLMERGMFFHRTIKVIFDPIAGNVTARNKGAKIAQGKYLFFSDSHMSFKVGSFKAMIEGIDKHGGIVHSGVQWMGGYYPSDASYQYTIKLGEKVWGTWNRNIVSTTEPFYIPSSGHCFLGMLKEEFEQFGGYNPWFRCYGGGELYLSLKWWMMGSTVSSVPTAIAYHLSAGRGYSFKQDDLIHNMMVLALSLGADAMAERIYIRYLGKDGINRNSLDKMFSEAKLEAQSDRELLLPRCIKSFYEVLEVKPWDKLNIEKFGTACSSMGIYDRTWTDTLSGEAKELFASSSLQRELQELIDTKFSQYIYKPEN